MYKKYFNNNIFDYIIPLGNDTLYLVGTSVGLFATAHLDGTNTIWEQIGSQTIGAVVVEFLTFRHNDGLLVVGTHGNGIFQTNISSVGDVLVIDEKQSHLAKINIYPNPTSNKVNLEFEASVAGGIPILRTLKDGLATNKFKKIVGILNGTCNYILTEMENSNDSFINVLKKAQKLGYAEPSNPKLDLNGYDALAKVRILSSLAFNNKISKNSCLMEGIENIEQLAFVKLKGAQLAQGYYYSRPVDISDVKKIQY